MNFPAGGEYSRMDDRGPDAPCGNFDVLSFDCYGASAATAERAAFGASVDDRTPFPDSARALAALAG